MVILLVRANKHVKLSVMKKYWSILIVHIESSTLFYIKRWYSRAQKTSAKKGWTNNFKLQWPWARQIWTLSMNVVMIAFTFILHEKSVYIRFPVCVIHTNVSNRKSRESKVMLSHGPRKIRLKSIFCSPSVLIWK